MDCPLVSCRQQLLICCPKGRQTEEGPEDACLNVNGMTNRRGYKDAASCSTSATLNPLSRQPLPG